PEQRKQEADRGVGSEDDLRQRELLYRAILEMRMDMRDLKEQIGSLMSNVGVVVPREVAERGDFPGDYEDFVVVESNEDNSSYRPRRDRDRPGGGEVDSLMRDVVYEVSESGSARATPRREEASSTREPEEPRPAEAEAEIEPETDEPEELPTLEEAEKQLISRALKQFDGNRRKTAQALGISERTLYRKLNDIDEDL
ncbi:MAG: helix-turn-helix domain-containing protein, partial [Salinibacter sp.]